MYRRPLFGFVPLLLLFIIGCGSNPQAASTSSPTPIAGSFLAAPATVVSGSSSTLTWNISNASSVTIDHGIGAVAASGSVAVTPTATTTYTLTGTGAAGTAAYVQTAIVTVTTPPPAPTALFSAAPVTIQAGQSTILTWNTTNATTVSIDQGVGAVAVSGSMTVSPSQTTTYTLTASNGPQSVTQTATVTVAATPTIQFSASPTSIQSGGSSTLAWTVQNADTVSIDQSVGTVASSGTKMVSPTQTTTYTLTATGGGHAVTSSAQITVAPVAPALGLTGVLQWKSGQQGLGLYSAETKLTPANVIPAEFGKVRTIQSDGELLPQPLYVRAVNLGAKGVHDLILVSTEHDSVFAYDGSSNSTTPLWQVSFLNPVNGISTQADDHGGRSTFGGEIGITGTPFVDANSGILYVVAATQQNSVVTDTLHAIDITTGTEVNGSGVVITATVPGTGEGSVNGQIAFAPAQQNQRPGLTVNNGLIYIAFGSFSDYPPYHGWLFAYDEKTLQQVGVFISTPNFRADYDMGSGAAFWNGGASPSFEADGSFYVVAADGSTNWETGGDDYGDTVLHMSFSNGKFNVLDKFTPFNRDCIDHADLEMGSGGVTLLPPEVGGSSSLGVVLTKEGRLYLLDRDNLGGYNPGGDQVVEQVMVGNHVCDGTSNESEADGAVWNRLYGDASYWNGNLYMGASNETVNQYTIRNGMISQSPMAVSSSTTGPRGANTTVSANGATNGIVWAYEKTGPCTSPNVPAGCGTALLHAYDATNITNETWNSNINASRDALNTGGQAFQVPVVIDGKVIVTSGHFLDVFALLP